MELKRSLVRMDAAYRCVDLVLEERVHVDGGSVDRRLFGEVRVLVRLGLNVGSCRVEGGRHNRECG